jgi:antitoxin (DNA-binding transcriptional repressor) of toxin-antitoxin stability system
LRQNLSVYLRRVKAGETLPVTEHGHLVAVLGPPPKEPMSVLEQWVADGLATPPTRDPSTLGPPQPLDVPLERPLSQVLMEMRSEERD